MEEHFFWNWKLLKFERILFDKEYFFWKWKKEEYFILLDSIKFERERKELFIYERINRLIIFNEIVEITIFVSMKNFFGNVTKEREDFFLENCCVGNSNESSFNFVKSCRGCRVVKSY